MDSIYMQAPNGAVLQWTHVATETIQSRSWFRCVEDSAVRT
jgi:hypothetical protein